MPLAKKRGRDSFKQLVRDCTCPDEILTKERIEKFAARARAYICTYHHLANGPSAEKQQLLFVEIERLMQLFKVHRCALDFDRGFVASVLKEKKE